MKGELVSSSLEVKTSVAVGAAIDVSHVESMYLQVTGTFTATLELEGSYDGSKWLQVGTDITAAGYVAISGRYKQLRVNTTAYTSGTPYAVLSGSQAW